MEYEGPALWRESGEPLSPGVRMVPDITAFSGAPHPDAPMRADPKRPWLIKYGKHLRGAIDRIVARSSQIPNHAILDVRDFAWTASLRENWQAIRDEAVEAALRGRQAPSLASVSPDHRAQGVGGALLRRLFEEGRGKLPFTLEVRVSNRPAITMYERLGFRSAGVRPRYYQDNGEDALIMWLD